MAVSIRRSNWRIAAGFGTALVLLSGCGGSNDFGGCPSVAALSDASRLVRFAPRSERDLRDVLFEAAIADMTGACDYDGNVIDADVDVLFTIRRGPADRRREGAFRYFVSLIGPEDQILYRGDEVVGFAFESDKTVAQVESDLDFSAALIPGAGGFDHRILVGFQLTRQELEFNRRLKR